MNWNIISILIVTLLLINICSASSVVYVNTDGSGDYNCNGINDHIEINQALVFVGNSDEYNTVHLKGSNTYWIDGSISIDSDTMLCGDSSAILKLVNSAGWSPGIPIIGEMDTCGNDNITISGFEIDGNSDNQGLSFGREYYRHIALKDSTNIDIYNMYLHDGNSDFIRIEHDTHTDDARVSIHDNVMNKSGHEAVVFVHAGNCTVYNNDIFTRTNSAVRLVSSNHINIYNNVLHSRMSGTATGPAIQLQKGNGYAMDDIEIHHNTIHDIVGSGIWMFGEDKDNVIRGKNVHIHHNIFYHVGQYWRNTGYSNAGITLGQYNNTLIENNVFDDCGYASIKRYIPSVCYEMSTPFNTIVRNNIIINNDDDYLGVGIWNYDNTGHTFVSKHNCIYNNVGGAYSGIGIININDIYVAPMLYNENNHEYYLQSEAGTWNGIDWESMSFTSPLVDAGHITSDYSNEPEPNGNRINIGRYGNTIYASKSSLEPQIHEPINTRLKESKPNTVLNKSTYIDVGKIDSKGRYRSVLLFDLSSYNSTDVIESANVSLYWYYEYGLRKNTTRVSVYHPVKWNEQYVTWNSNNSDINWDAPGSDWYDKHNIFHGLNSYDTLDFDVGNGPSNTYHNFDVTELVQKYVDNTHQNMGFLLKTDEISNDYIAFYSQKYQDETKRPKLTITLSNGSIPDPSNTWAIFCNWSGISKTVVTPSNTDLFEGWNMLYVMGNTNRTILDIKMDIGDNCTNMSAYNVTIGNYTYDDAYTLQPNECFLAEISNDMTWNRSLL